MVVYFSGTGNSRYCAKRIAEQLQDELLDCSSYIKHQIAADLISGKPWVFVCPTYAWRLPLIVEAFIRTGCFAGNQDAYFVLTCGDDIGNADKYLRKLCDEVGMQYRGVARIVMPENYVAMFPVPNEEEAEKIISDAEPDIIHASDLVRQGCDFPAAKIQMKDHLKSGIVNRCFYRFCVKADPFYATDACIGCGVCVDQCVCNNISLVNGAPTWGNQCTHCMACICGCPAEAIEYGKKSLGKPRYQCKK